MAIIAVSVTDVATVVGGVAAIASLVYAKKAASVAEQTLTEQRAGGLLDDQRHEAAEEYRIAALRPRPEVTGLVGTSGGKVEITYANVGGAALPWLVFLQHRDSLFRWQLPIPAHYTLPPGGLARLTPVRHVESATPDGEVSVLCSFARDVEGLWWDCHRDERLTADLSLDYVRHALLEEGVAPADAAVLTFHGQ